MDPTPTVARREGAQDLLDLVFVAAGSKLVQGGTKGSLTRATSPLLGLLMDYGDIPTLLKVRSGDPHEACAHTGTRCAWTFEGIGPDSTIHPNRSDFKEITPSCSITQMGTGMVRGHGESLWRASAFQSWVLKWRSTSGARRLTSGPEEGTLTARKASPLG